MGSSAQRETSSYKVRHVRLPTVPRACCSTAGTGPWHKGYNFQATAPKTFSRLVRRTQHEGVNGESKPEQRKPSITPVIRAVSERKPNSEAQKQPDRVLCETGRTRLVLVERSIFWDPLRGSNGRSLDPAEASNWTPLPRSLISLVERSRLMSLRV